MRTPPLPPLSAKMGPGRKRSGPVPAWALKLASLTMTLLVFGSGLGFASTHVYATNAPLQPAQVVTTSTSPTTTTTTSTSSRTTTRLTPSVQRTTQTPVTSTQSS